MLVRNTFHQLRVAWFGGRVGVSLRRIGLVLQLVQKMSFGRLEGCCNVLALGAAAKLFAPTLKLITNVPLMIDVNSIAIPNGFFQRRLECWCETRFISCVLLRSVAVCGYRCGVLLRSCSLSRKCRTHNEK